MPQEDKPLSPQDYSRLNKLLEAGLIQFLEIAKIDKRFRNLLACSLDKMVRHEGNRNVDMFVVKKLKATMDKMIVDKQSRCFLYKDNPGLAPNTIRIKLHAARTYILDYDDPDGRYGRLMAQCELQEMEAPSGRKGESPGIALALIYPENSDRFESRILDMQSTTTFNALAWRDRLTDFIENAEVGTQLVMNDMELSEEEQQMLKDLNVIHPDIEIKNVSREQFTIRKYPQGERPEVV